MDDLKALREHTMNEVCLAVLQPDMKQTKPVENWLSGVEVMEGQVEELISEASQEIENKCLGGCCPQNCKASYKVGKKVAKKLKEVADLQSRGRFEAVAEKHLPLVVERPIVPTVGLESTFDKVWSCIEDERTGIIGLYGLGGVGKTTLLNQINNKFSTTAHKFDVVICIVVSSNPNSAKIQEDIGKRIGICDSQWKEKTEEDKASDILRVLRKKKFVLLLDDIWARFELLDVCVPLPDGQNKSKLVFTTRSEDVCGHMEVCKKIKVESLTWEEAWDLFQKKVGVETINFLPEITELGKIVARECDGLPLALITIGRALACKNTPQEWRHAITMLKKSSAEFPGMGENVYPRLKFSYDSLQSDTIKSCFLYCSLFPEDHSISKKKLIEYWIGEGFSNGFDDLDGAQNWGYDIIGTLVRACLLEEDSSSCVKMHDVIRDMALWIAGGCEKVKKKVLVQAGVRLRKAPEVKKWEGVEMVSLMHNGIKELTEVPICPDLSTLFLNENRLKAITCGFFQNMPNLRVLDLSSNYELVELPKEISKMVSLRYLNLSRTQIKELQISEMVSLRYLNLSQTKIKELQISEMVSLQYLNLSRTEIEELQISEFVPLQYLNLSNTGIEELPIEYKKLVELKYLNLAYADSLNIIPAGVLSSFKKLRVLKMVTGVNFVERIVEDSEFETLVKELECLKELNELSINIATTSALSRFLSCHKLPTFTTKLSLRTLEDSEYVDICGLQSMMCLRKFSMYACRDLKHLKAERANLEPCFHSLRNVSICGCWRLKELTCLIFAPNLEILGIQFCHEMEEVISSEATKEGGYLNPFAKLKRLQLYHLPQLKSIYPNALPFPRLNSISALLCENLKKLPLNSDSAKGCGLVISGSNNWWNDLEWEDEATRNAFLSSFRP